MEHRPYSSEPLGSKGDPIGESSCNAPCECSPCKVAQGVLIPLLRLGRPFPFSCWSESGGFSCADSCPHCT